MQRSIQGNSNTFLWKLNDGFACFVHVYTCFASSERLHYSTVRLFVIRTHKTILKNVDFLSKKRKGKEVLHYFVTYLPCFFRFNHQYINFLFLYAQLLQNRSSWICYICQHITNLLPITSTLTQVKNFEKFSVHVLKYWEYFFTSFYMLIFKSTPLFQIPSLNSLCLLAQSHQNIFDCIFVLTLNGGYYNMQSILLASFFMD